MCNLYSITKGQQAIRDLAGAMRGNAGNMPPLPGVFPDYSVPIVRNAPDRVRELTMARWGMPSPVFALEGRNSDPGVTNVRNVASPRGRRGISTGTVRRLDGPRVARWTTERIARRWTGVDVLC
jgi:putative SOS response-associated peptidase YedK